MGGKYQVFDWRQDAKTGTYKYFLEYDDRSMFKAIITMIRLRRAGSKCLKFEWR